MKSKTLSILSASIAAALSLSIPAAVQAQAPAAPAAGGNNNGGNNGGGRRGGQNFNPEEFRQRMNERLKTALKASDDEWKVLQPLIEKVQTAQRSTGGGFGGFGGRGGRPPGGGDTTTTDNRPRSASAEASDALRKALEDENTPAADLKAKLSAVRDARKKGQAELTASRDELRKVLTARQEAVLVSMGILD